MEITIRIANCLEQILFFSQSGSSCLWRVKKVGGKKYADINESGGAPIIMY